MARPGQAPHDIGTDKPATACNQIFRLHAILSGHNHFMSLGIAQQSVRECIHPN
jgi:hypothetical protein